MISFLKHIKYKNNSQAYETTLEKQLSIREKIIEIRTKNVHSSP